MCCGDVFVQVGKADWQAVQQGPPWAVDAWGLGCLIQEAYRGRELTRTEELRDTSSIPKTVLPVSPLALALWPSEKIRILSVSCRIGASWYGSIRSWQCLCIADGIRQLIASKSPSHLQ